MFINFSIVRFKTKKKKRKKVGATLSTVVRMHDFDVSSIENT